MAVKKNLFIDDKDLSITSSLTHLLDRDNVEDDAEPHVLKHSPYYTEQQFTNLLKRKNGLCILDLNVGNAFTKFDELESFVYRVNIFNPISVICLNECWLNERSDVSILNLRNYKMFHQIGNCPGHSHCGLITYVHEQFNCNEILINQPANGWEYLCVEISHHKPNSKKHLICNLYRPPESLVEELDLFISQFSSFLNLLKHTKRSNFISADFNINLLQINTNKHFSSFFELITTKGYFPRITLPTRIQPPSFSLIDNILYNRIEENSESGVLINDISDHKMIFTYHENNAYTENNNKYIDIEKRDDISISNFIEELKTMNIYGHLNKDLDSSPQTNYEILAQLLKYAREKHLPKMRIKFKKKKHKKSKWMTDNILKLLNTKDLLYKRLVQTDTENTILYNRLKSEFIAFRTMLRRSIREAKRLYYLRTFNLFKNNIKKTWSLINDSMKRNSMKTMNNEFMIDNKKTSDPQIIANAFNDYFINIGHSLAENIHSPIHFTQYLRQEISSSFKFKIIDETVTENTINKLKNKSSYGVDGLSNKLIKSAKNYLIIPLTLIINQTLKTGEFPNELKIARVKPLFKAGNSYDICNYRPISLLPSISKIFERIIFQQLFEYLNNNKLISCEQFGFRPGYSTELASLRLIDHITKQMDQMELPLNIYIDLSKAFDTLDHTILLSKMNFYGISGRELNLFRNYIINRHQFVEFNGCKSIVRTISTGVPQGSILGPLLFLIYINDLPHVSNLFEMLMYADDTTLFCNIKHTTTEVELNTELKKISNWLSSNKLSLNVKKSKYMVFHTSQRQVEYPLLKLNDTEIERVNQFNFLGLIISSNLKWNKHIDHISLKLSKIIGILYRLKDLYQQNILIMLYNSLIVPHFNYCLLTWGSKISKDGIIHILQKRALRTITSSNYISHTEPLCKELGLIKVTDMFRLAIWKFYFKLMNNTLPSYFESFKPVLPPICNFHEIRRPNFHLPDIKHEFAKCSLKYCLINILNNEKASIVITSKVHTHSFLAFKLFLKYNVLNSYQEFCIVMNCESCQRELQVQ